VNEKDMRNAGKTLPLIKGLSKDVVLTLLITGLMVVISFAGLFFQDEFYPTRELREGFVTTDVINLVLGVPLLIGSVILFRRGRLLGLLMWPGALFFVTYHYIAYAAIKPLTGQFFVYLVLVLMSAWALIRLMMRMDSVRVKEKISLIFPVRFTAIVLILFGFIFMVRAIDSILASISEGMALPPTEFADLIISPIWIVGGLLLWKRKPLGYVAGASSLIHASALFLGLLIYFVLQPIMSSVPFPVEDFIVIFLMGFVFFLPLGRFLKGMLKIA
jgi:hypothetical protein